MTLTRYKIGKYFFWKTDQIRICKCGKKTKSVLANNLCGRCWRELQNSKKLIKNSI